MRENLRSGNEKQEIMRLSSIKSKDLKKLVSDGQLTQLIILIG